MKNFLTITRLLQEITSLSDGVSNDSVHKEKPKKSLKGIIYECYAHSNCKPLSVNAIA